jgi:hypothetical protein
MSVEIGAHYPGRPVVPSTKRQPVPRGARAGTAVCGGRKRQPVESPATSGGQPRERGDRRKDRRRPAAMAQNLLVNDTKQAAGWQLPKPSAVRRVAIPKPDGRGERILGIPTVSSDPASRRAGVGAVVRPRLFGNQLRLPARPESHWLTLVSVRCAAAKRWSRMLESKGACGFLQRNTSRCTPCRPASGSLCRAHRGLEPQVDAPCRAHQRKKPQPIEVEAFIGCGKRI